MTNTTTPAAALESIKTSFASADADDMAQVLSGVLACAAYDARQAGRSEIALADLASGAAFFATDEDAGVTSSRSCQPSTVALAAKVAGHLAAL